MNLNEKQNDTLSSPKTSTNISSYPSFSSLAKTTEGKSRTLAVGIYQEVLTELTRLNLLAS